MKEKITLINTVAQLLSWLAAVGLVVSRAGKWLQKTSVFRFKKPKTSKVQNFGF